MKHQNLAGVGTTLLLLVLGMAMVQGTNLGGAGIVCSDEWDFWDDDDDGLTNCAEMALGTLLNNPDTDDDGLLDGMDLAPSTNTPDVAVGIEIALLEEHGTRCDINAARYWDPYFESLFVEIPTWEDDGGRDADLTRIGFTKGSHPHDVRSHSPESIAASLDLPTDAGLYQLDSIWHLPFIDLRMGLYDHDEGTPSDAVDWGGGRGLPISAKPDGTSMTVRFRGEAECRSLIRVSITSPITFEDAYLSPIADALTGSGQNGAAALRDLPDSAQDTMFADGYLQNWIGEVGISDHANSILAVVGDDWTGDALTNPPGWDNVDHSDISTITPHDPDCHLLSVWSMAGYRPAVDAQMTMRAIDGDDRTLNITSASVSRNFTASSMIGMPAVDVCGIGESIQVEFRDVNGAILYAKRWLLDAPMPAVPTGDTLYIEIDGDSVSQSW